MTAKPEITETDVEVSKSKKKYNRVFNTDLMNKEEAFKMLALAECLGLPVLLVGEPGTAKTKTVTDFVKGRFDLSDPKQVEHFNNEGVFMLETDEGTKSSDIKGVVDLEALVTTNKFMMNSPVTKADCVIINEVDKASSSLRNALLGIMNEKVLFTGKEKIKCNWSLFVATCNEIPKDELKSPFWDRFVLKMTMTRMKAGDLIRYYKEGGKKYSTPIRLTVPTIDEIEAVIVSADKLEKFIDLTYKSCSDRTLSFVPTMTKAVSLVYNCSVDKALIKVCEFLVGTNESQKLSKMLLSAEKKNILDKVDLITGMQSETQIQSAITEVENLVGSYVKSGKFSQTDVEEIRDIVEMAMANHPFYEATVEFDEEVG